MSFVNSLEPTMDKFFLAHLNSEPVIYGLVIIAGIATIWWKIVRGHLGSALLEITIFVLVFKMHGGTLTGGMAAAVAALIGGFLIPLITRIARIGRR